MIAHYDEAFVAGVTLALMALCVFSGAGTPLFLAAIGGGAVAAVARSRRRPPAPSIRELMYERTRRPGD